MALVGTGVGVAIKGKGVPTGVLTFEFVLVFVLVSHDTTNNTAVNKSVIINGFIIYLRVQV